MNFLRKYLDKQKPKFEKGGKLQKLHSVFTGFESFLFVPNRTTSSGSNIRDAIDLKRTMIIVVLALVPALLFGIFNSGIPAFQSHRDISRHGLYRDVLLRALEGVTHDHRFLRGRSGNRVCRRPDQGTRDQRGIPRVGIIDPDDYAGQRTPLVVGVSTAFAVIIGKEIFGGTGMNIWNPALLARAFFFFSTLP